MYISHEAYMIGQRIVAEGPPFYALIQAAMRQADTDNLDKLKAAWPEAWVNLHDRWLAPGGYLEGERRQ